jgi:tetratricopeptide (TPR) repeat protein
MVVASQRHQDDDAFRFAQLARQRLERYLSTGPIDPGEAEQVVIVLMNVANRYMMAGRLDEAIAMARRTIDIANDTNQPAQAGAALTVVARAERARGHLDAALAAAHEAARLLHPSDGDTAVSRRLVYSLALTREAAILGSTDGLSLGRPDEAVPLLKQAYAIAEDVAAHDPAESTSRQRLATAGLELAPLLRDANPQAALAIYDHVLQRLGEVKNNTVARIDEVSALAGSTYALRALSRSSEIHARLDAAFSTLAQLHRDPKAPVEPGSETADALTALADEEAAQGHRGRAIAIYQDLLKRVLATKPKPETDSADALALSELYASLEALERRDGRLADADELHARRTLLWETWNRTLPGAPFVARELARLSQ